MTSSSLNLDKLRAVTGVFIKRTDYEIIQLEYRNYLESQVLEDSNIFARKFIKKWKAEQEILGTFAETLDGYIKYYCIDGEPQMKITTQEFLDEFDMLEYYWENLCRSYWQIFREILGTDKVDKQLLTNILAEEATPHEQIFELTKVMRIRQMN